MGVARRCRGAHCHFSSRNAGPFGALPFWEAFRSRPRALAAIRGINAAVVELLGAALYNPVWSSSVRTPADLCVVLIGFVLLIAWRASPLLVVIAGAVGGMALAK